MIVQIEYDRVILKSETHAERCQLSFLVANTTNEMINFHWDEMDAVVVIKQPSKEV